MVTTLKQAKQIMKNVLSSHFEHLSQQLRLCLPRVAEEMYSCRLINETVLESPTAYKLIQEFKNGMQCVVDILKLQEHCRVFLQCLSIEDGPMKLAAQNLCKDWMEEVNKKCSVSLDLLCDQVGGSTALIIASQYGHTQVVEQLLKEQTDVNIQTNDGWTALMIASQNGHTQVIEQLLKEHVYINIQNNKGMTALMKASENGHTQVVEQLLKEGAHVNIQNKNGVTALMIASQNDHTQVIEQLLKEHADVNTQTNDGWTALMLASQNGHTEVVEQLLKEHADVNIQTNDGWTALMIASQNDHTQVVKQLLKEHAGVNIQNKEVTALMLASANGYVQIVELLAKGFVDIDVQKKDGSKALMLACLFGHVEVAECLLQSFADPHIIAYNGSTAFSLAALSGNRDLVNILLDKAEPTIDEIEKAVVTSCYGGHPTLITFLSNKLPHLTNDQRELLDSCVKGDLGAVIMKTLGSPDIPLVLGLTPLMVASSCGHVDIVDVLILAGADVNKQESHLGLTPLFFAVRGSKSSSIIETLLMYGAHPNIIAVTNKTPLDIATDINKTFEMDAISKLLIKHGGRTTLSFQTITNIISLEDTSYIIRRKTNQLEIPSFISFINSFT